MSEFLHDFGSLSLVLAAVAAHIFPALYTRSAWSISAIGRDAMTFAVAVAVILDLSVAVRVFGLSGDIRLVLAAVVYAVLAVLFCRRVWLLVRIQRDPAAFAARDARRLARRQARRHTPSD